MSISGLVIHAAPAKVPGVTERLKAIPGVEIHAANDDGRLVVTVDLPDDKTSADTLFKIKDIEGVADASLVYNYFDDTDQISEGANKEETYEVN